MLLIAILFVANLSIYQKTLMLVFSQRKASYTYFIHPIHRLGYLSLNGLSSNLLPWCWCQAFHDQALVVSRVAQGTRKGTKRANPRHHLLSGRDRFWTVFWSTLFCWWEVNCQSCCEVCISIISMPWCAGLKILKMIRMSMVHCFTIFFLFGYAEVLASTSWHVGRPRFRVFQALWHEVNA